VLRSAPHFWQGREERTRAAFVDGVAQSTKIRTESVKKKAIKTAKKVAAKSRPKAAATKKAAASPATRQSRRKQMPDSQKKILKDLLLSLRERINAQIQALKGDSLQRHDEVNTTEDGTDAFERQFALNIVSSENDSLIEIDEALERLDEGSYGVCEDCSGLIEIPRLRALPFVRKCVACQSKSEAGGGKVKPAAAGGEI
jgi:DnaK suppressor protein